MPNHPVILFSLWIRVPEVLKVPFYARPVGSVRVTHNISFLSMGATSNKVQSSSLAQPGYDMHAHPTHRHGLNDAVRLRERMQHFANLQSDGMSRMSVRVRDRQGGDAGRGG